MKMKGRVGAYSFYTSTGGRQVARIANNSSNFGESAKRTVAMQTRRTRWGNLVSFFRANKDLMARAFERKDANLSDYNRFMQLNIPRALVSLPKDAFMRGITILQPYVVADGSLPSLISDVMEEDEITFNLFTSLDGEFADYTIGAVSADLLKQNTHLQVGDQLTFVSWTNAENVGGGLRTYRYLCELTLDPESNVSFGTLPFANIVGGNAQRIILNGKGPVFGQTIIHSRVMGGTLLVSRSEIVLNSTMFIEQFSSEDAVKRAIDSYGVDAEKLLEPGSPEQQTPKPMPALPLIHTVVEPAGSANLKITVKDSGEVFYNTASLPVGTIVELTAQAAVGWETAISPIVEDTSNYEVKGNVTFYLKSTRA